MITLCGFCDLELLQQGQAGAAREGRPLHRRARRRPAARTRRCSSCSPLGKMPFIRTEHGTLCESQAILDYLEAAAPEPRAAAGRPLGRGQGARARSTFIDLHLELVARELYAQAFFGGDDQRGQRRRACASSSRRTSPASSGWRSSRPTWPATLHAGRLRRLGQPAAGGAWPRKIVYGEDLLAAAGIDWKGYGKLIGERASGAAGRRPTARPSRTQPRPPPRADARRRASGQRGRAGRRPWRRQRPRPSLPCGSG